MRTSLEWKDYELLDASNGERLERWGDIILIRPDPQVIWATERKMPLWNQAHAKYHRSKSGGGFWETYKKVPNNWRINYRGLTFNLKPMSFKHTGVFPEQAVNWDFVSETLSLREESCKILNLFAYTGAATVNALAKGAAVTHVDAAKGMVEWAKENAKASGVADKSVRWLVDDCFKFVQKEIRRGNTYDAIIMDPPSYGRGPSGEFWKFEEHIDSFIQLCVKMLSTESRFMLINFYTTGISHTVIGYLLEQYLKPKFGGSVLTDEIGLRVTSTGLVLPAGATAIWKKD